jgi:hypothetical protein
MNALSFYKSQNVLVQIFNFIQNVYQFLVWPKQFVPEPNIFGPVEGRGRRLLEISGRPTNIKFSFWKKADYREALVRKCQRE